MKKLIPAVILISSILIIQPLPAKVNWLKKMQYIPGRTDVCVTVNLESLRKYMEKKGIKRSEIIELLDDGTSDSPLKNGIVRNFLFNLKRAAIVFDAFELKKKNPKEFLILVDGDKEVKAFEAMMEEVPSRTFKGVKLYEVEKKDDAWLCRVEKLFLLGNSRLIESYLSAYKKKKKTISKTLLAKMAQGESKDIFLYFPLGRLIETELRKTMALGKGLGGSGLEENVFIKSLYNLQYITLEGAFQDRITFSLALYGKSREDAKRLTMINHFLIVGSSFLFPFADKLSRSLTKKKLNVKNENLIRIQRIIGRIKTEELKRGTRISFSLTEKETTQFIAAMKQGIRKAIDDRKKKAVAKQDVFEFIKKKDFAALKKSLDAGASTQKKNKKGETLLFAAARSGSLEAVKLIILKGASVKALNDNDRKSPLHGAVISRSPEIVTFLIEKGGEVNRKDTFGHYPLHLAVKAKHLQITRLLIAAGADPKVKALDGETPLHVAAEEGVLDIIDELLKAGADRMAKDFYGDTPASRAAKKGHREAAEKLK